MKRTGIILLFFTLFTRASDQALAPIAQQLTSITKLSDAQLQSFWGQLQTIIDNRATQPASRQRANELRQEMIKEKIRRITKDKDAQEAISQLILDALLAASFEGAALMLGGASAQQAVYTAVIHQLASTMVSSLTKNMSAIISLPASGALGKFTDWVLKLPSAGKGLAVLDPVSIIPYGAKGARVILNKLGYTEKTIAAFNQTQQAVANFIQSLY